MSLKKQKKLVDESFAQFFPNWETLSPYDPIRVFSESMALAFHSIQSRQKQTIDTILTSLPALLGFASKPAQKAEQLYLIEAAQALNRPVIVSSASTFRFQQEKSQYQVVPIQDFTILPLSDVGVKRSGNSVTLQLQHRGPSQCLSLQFIPDSNTVSSMLESLICTVVDDRSGTEKQFTLTELLVTESSDEWTLPSVVSVRPRDAKENFANDNSTMEIELRFSTPVPGEFLFNAFLGRPSAIVHDCPLGQLEGNPWEELSLENSLLTPPEKLTLEFPNGQAKMISMVQRSYLLTLAKNDGVFQDGFYFDPGRHCLVFPSSEGLVSNFDGAIKVISEEAVEFIVADGLGESFQFIPGEFSSVISKLTPSTLQHRATPRESGSAYLERFHNRLVGLHSTDSTSLEFLRQSAMTEIPSLRCLEFQLDSKAKTLTLYALVSDPSTGTVTPVPPPIRQQLQRLGEAALPIDFTVAVSAFRKTIAQLGLSLSAEIDAQTPMNADAVQFEIEAAARKICLPSPYGELRPTTPLSWEIFQSHLNSALQDRVHISHLTGNVAVGEPSTFVGAIRRQPGECITLEIQTALRLKAKARTVTHAS